MKSTPHVDEVPIGKVLEFDVHGRLDRTHYERFIPEIERAIMEHGTIRILVTMHGFLGCEPSAFSEDLRWNTKHIHQIERMAIVGEKTCHSLFTAFFQPFTSASFRYFSLQELGAAHAWITEDASTV
jgi:hypothetical protein